MTSLEWYAIICTAGAIIQMIIWGVQWLRMKEEPDSLHLGVYIVICLLLSPIPAFLL